MKISEPNTSCCPAFESLVFTSVKFGRSAQSPYACVQKTMEENFMALTNAKLIELIETIELLRSAGWTIEPPASKPAAKRAGRPAKKRVGRPPKKRAGRPAAKRVGRPPKKRVGRPRKTETS